MLGKYIVHPGGSIHKTDDILEWGQWMETAHKKTFLEGGKVVAKTQIAGLEISTLFLGLDYSHRMGGTPVLFETMVFNKPDGDNAQERYTTVDEAQRGHARILGELFPALSQGDEGTPPEFRQGG